MQRKETLLSAPVGSAMARHLSEPAAAQKEIHKLDFSAREQAVALFHRTYDSTVAYRDFVDKSGVDVSKIQSATDFERIPIMSKENYILQYPLTDRLVDGQTMADCYMMTATTGSTGEPVLWPRDYPGDQALLSAFERVYRGCFQIDKKRTLHIIQNFLSTTPGGMVMAQLSWAASANHQMTTITPGVDLDRAIVMIKEMGACYDQIIISTYPPYVKMFLARAEEAGLRLSDYDIKFASTGDGFSQPFRNHIVSRLGDHAGRGDIISLYGCTEAGLVGAETPFSVALAAAADDNALLANHLFGTSDVPNLMAYSPTSKLLETIDTSSQFNELLITADQPAPLIRYNIHDRGGILSGKDIQQAIHDYGLSLTPPADDERFVYVFGRSNSVMLLGGPVYIEAIHYCLENSRFADRLTGEFQYGSRENDQLEEELAVVVHLKPDCTMTDAEQEAFHQEFWHHFGEMNPTLLLFGEDTFHRGLLKISFAHGTDQIERSGKYKYFL